MGKNQDPGSGINIPDPQHCINCSNWREKRSAAVYLLAQIYVLERTNHPCLLKSDLRRAYTMIYRIQDAKHKTRIFPDRIPRPILSSYGIRSKLMSIFWNSPQRWRVNASKPFPRPSLLPLVHSGPSPQNLHITLTDKKKEMDKERHGGKYIKSFPITNLVGVE